MFILAGLLVLGFICNALVTPVNSRFHQPAKDPIPSTVPTTGSVRAA
jgi:hypothetical protein